MRDDQSHEHVPMTSSDSVDATRAGRRNDDLGPTDHALRATPPTTEAHYHDTDCSEFLLRIYEYMDGEMGPEENLRFEAHVRECRPCLQQHKVDQTVKGLIRRVASETVAPETLRASIMARITTIRFESRG